MKDAGNTEVVQSNRLRINPDSGISLTGEITSSEGQALGEDFDVLVGLDSEGFTPDAGNPWPTINDRAIFGHFKDTSGTVRGVQAVGSRFEAFIPLAKWTPGDKDFVDGEKGFISLQQSPM